MPKSRGFQHFSRYLLPVFLVGVWLGIFVESTRAQVTPNVRNKAYKQAAPGRFEKRFEKPTRPKSSLVPVKPDTMKPMFPPGLKNIKFVFRQIIIKGTTVYNVEDFEPFFKKLLRREISLMQVYKIANTITNKYRNDGYILSKAIVPPQKIENGVVKLEIIEGYIDQVKVQGEVRGPRALLNAYRRKIMKSRPLRAEDLERYLLLTDDLPGVTAKSIITPSERVPGASDLTLVLENKVVDAQAGMDNRGNDFNGPLQVSGGLIGNSLFKGYERLGAQAVVTSDPNELWYASGFLEAPISSEGTKVFFSGSVSNSTPGSSLEQFDVEGDSSTIGLRITHPFIRSRGKNLTGYFGFTSRDTRTDILDTPDSEDRLRILDVGFSYDLADRFRGINLFQVSLSQGLDIFNATETGSERLSREDGHSDFTKLSGEILRLQQLAPSWSLLGSMSWQYAFQKLLASEEYGVGGIPYGRAYDYSEITGDSGLAFKVELQRAFQPGWSYLKDFQAYTFYDYGSTWSRIKVSDSSTRQDLSSAGLGVRFNMTDYISGYVELAKPLTRDVASEGNDDPRVFFSLSARY